MLKIISGDTGVGSEVKIRDYSEPLQNQKDLSSYASRYVYNFDFGVEPDTTDITLYENQMIRIWRAMAENPYIDFAIDDIVNEMISYAEDEKYPIQLDLNNTKFSKTIRSKIHDEWIFIMKLLRFHKKSYMLLRDWYIDGKQYFYVEYSKNSIQKITVLNPLKTKKILNEDNTYSYIYHDEQINNNTIIEIPSDNIIEMNSGLMDNRHNIWISYLNKAYIPLNQLNNIEDALLIYRIARAPERRVFYIDTGQLSKSKAETYMKEVIRQLRNKVEYDPSTGKIKETSNQMSLLDDIYLPRSAEGRGTEVSTLQGGSNLGEINDLDYFKIKLFRALNVPFTRWSELNAPAGVLGRAQEITRDEIKYRKFIVRLRNCYNVLFTTLLKKQLSLKNIIKETEFNDEYENIMFEWCSDSFFAELRDNEIFNERLNVVDRVIPNVGTYFSKKYVLQKILRYTDSEIDKMNDEINDEKSNNSNNFNTSMNDLDYNSIENNIDSNTESEDSIIYG